jgi:cytochrome c553
MAAALSWTISVSRTPTSETERVLEAKEMQKVAGANRPSAILSGGSSVIDPLLQSVRMSGMQCISNQRTTTSFSLMLSSQSRSADVVSKKAAVTRLSIALTSLIGTWLLMCSSASFAADGENLFAPCVACHGAKGEGNATLNSPAIAGQDAVYVERQLRNFRNRRRGGDKSDVPGVQMQAAAAALADDAAVAKVASYVAKLPKTFNAQPARGNLHNGNNLYQGTCGACHGGKAEGNPTLQAPRLAGLDASYIKRQFAQFRDGVRGTDPHDTPGRQMALMAKTLATPRDLDDIVAFIHSQGRPK